MAKGQAERVLAEPEVLHDGQAETRSLSGSEGGSPDHPSQQQRRVVRGTSELFRPQAVPGGVSTSSLMDAATMYGLDHTTATQVTAEMLPLQSGRGQPAGRSRPCMAAALLGGHGGLGGPMAFSGQASSNGSAAPHAKMAAPSQQDSPPHNGISEGGSNSGSRKRRAAAQLAPPSSG